MSMESREKRLQVRALTGESITVPICDGKTVRDLKHLLKQTFPLASKYPNFNLYHKGIRLSLPNQISSYSIEPEEVIGLIPIVKKQNSQFQESCEQFNSGNVKDQAPIAKFADQAWNHMMHDLREMSNTVEETTELCGMHLNIGVESNSEISGVKSFERKRKLSDTTETTRTPDSLVLSILEHSRNTVLDEENAEKFVKVLDRVNCLQDASSQSCALSSSSHLGDGGLGTYQATQSSCLCPSWLKTVVKSLTFLNIYAACLQLRHENITLRYLEDALKRLGECGIHLNLKDIENVSVLCPTVVYFVDDEKNKRKFTEAIVISMSVEKCQAEEIPATAENQVSLPKLFYAMEKHERAFKMALRSLMSRIASDIMKIDSVEDVVNCLRERDTVKGCGLAGSKTKVKQLDRKKDASTSDSRNKINKLCHDTNALLTEEMVEHLKKGIGSCGQIVHIEEIGGRKPIYSEIPKELSEYTKQTLEQIGITKLYSHQADSVQASIAKKNVVVATLTSSGKSLCYNLPVLEELFKDSLSCALYIFPTKVHSSNPGKDSFILGG